MKFEIRDRAILSIFTGTVAALIANIFGYLSKLVYPPTIIMPEIASETWVNSSQVHTILGIVFGNLSSFVAGGLHALVFVTILDLTGWRFFWLKSLAVTTTGWLISSMFFLRILHIHQDALNDILSSIMFYLAHLVYLTISAFLVKKYGVDKKI